MVMVSLHGNKPLTKTPNAIPLVVGLMVLISKSHRASGFTEAFMMFSASCGRFPGVINSKCSSQDI